MTIGGQVFAVTARRGTRRDAGAAAEVARVSPWLPKSTASAHHTRDRLSSGKTCWVARLPGDRGPTRGEGPTGLLRPASHLLSFSCTTGSCEERGSLLKRGFGRGLGRAKSGSAGQAELSDQCQRGWNYAVFSLLGPGTREGCVSRCRAVARCISCMMHCWLLSSLQQATQLI